MSMKEKPAGNLVLECKKLVFIPCLKALAITLVAQASFLAAFITIVNFDIWHPIKWFLAIFGFHWLKHVPLLVVLFAFGIISSRNILGTGKYYPNRFKWLLDNGIQKILLLKLEMLFGFLTAWSFLSYLNKNYSSLYTELNGFTCINSYCVFLHCIGIAAGCYFFMRNHFKRDIEIEFNYVPQPTFMRLREAFFSSCEKSAENAIIPTFFFALSFWVSGSVLNTRLAFLFGVAVDDRLNTLLNIFTNLRLLIYAWLIVVEVFTIMTLMGQTFSIALTAQSVITGNILNYTETTMVAALSMNDVPVVQKLAALDFYNLAKAKSPERRKEIFTLSQLGGHPYNWNQLSGQCLSIINAYMDDLSSLLKSAPGSAQTKIPTLSLYNDIQPSALDMQHIFISQHREKYNIRRLNTDQHPLEQHNLAVNSKAALINENFNKTTERIIQRIVNIYRSLPGIFYLFGEPDGAKMSYLLAKSDLLIWIVQGLSDVCVASLLEDRYGVVQLTLPEIIKTFLKFKTEVEKLFSVHLNSKKLDSNLVPLRNAMKRCLHKICNSFPEFLPEIVEDPTDLRYLSSYLTEKSRH